MARCSGAARLAYPGMARIGYPVARTLCLPWEPLATVGPLSALFELLRCFLLGRREENRRGKRGKGAKNSKDSKSTRPRRPRAPSLPCNPEPYLLGDGAIPRAVFIGPRARPRAVVGQPAASSPSPHVPPSPATSPNAPLARSPQRTLPRVPQAPGTHCQTPLTPTIAPGTSL